MHGSPALPGLGCFHSSQKSNWKFCQHIRQIQLRLPMCGKQLNRFSGQSMVPCEAAHFFRQRQPGACPNFFCRRKRLSGWLRFQQQSGHDDHGGIRSRHSRKGDDLFRPDALRIQLNITRLRAEQFRMFAPEDQRLLNQPELGQTFVAPRQTCSGDRFFNSASNRWRMAKSTGRRLSGSTRLKSHSSVP